MCKLNMRKHKFDKFNVKVLDKLIEDDTSCVEMLTRRHHISLHPFHLNDINKSIKDVLNKGVAKYHVELDGILFGYKNVKLLSEKGRIFDDSCFIHVDVEADFFIFKPEEGKQLQGIINKKSKDHIGCLVHGLFNISVPKPEHEKGWMGKSLRLGSEVCLEIVYTNFEERLPYIKGKILSVISQPEGEDEPTKSDEECEADTTADLSQFESKPRTHLRFEDPPETPIKKKHKKSKKSKEADEDVDDSLPDLNLDQVFSSLGQSNPQNDTSFGMADQEDRGEEKPSRKRRHSTSFNMCIQSKGIELPDDSELDTLIGDVEVKKRKTSKKRQHEPDDAASPKKRKKT